MLTLVPHVTGDPTQQYAIAPNLFPRAIVDTIHKYQPFNCQRWNQGVPSTIPLPTRRPSSADAKQHERFYKWQMPRHNSYTEGAREGGDLIACGSARPVSPAITANLSHTDTLFCYCYIPFPQFKFYYQFECMWLGIGTCTARCLLAIPIAYVVVNGLKLYKEWFCRSRIIIIIIIIWNPRAGFYQFEIFELWLDMFWFILLIHH